MGAGIDCDLNRHPPRDRPRSVIDLHHYATEPAVYGPARALTTINGGAIVSQGE
jgi:hypothetical protein